MAEKTWKITPHEAGTHVHVQVRYGEIGHRALLGTLVMDREAWREFRLLMWNGAEVG